ncbi:hypothetical protein FQN60_003347 [Etheostoma spectabile]|uniref:Uncharacterized protein n=1 Tax=Etheostoma spectabile TaxID=54343 RepID=A0A5J5CMA4_9PERO|nr:hypothetical protein FQN60_003347 [Etheostoma spectabile]
MRVATSLRGLWLQGERVSTQPEEEADMDSEQDSQDTRWSTYAATTGTLPGSDKDAKSLWSDGQKSDCRFLIVAQSDGRWACQSEQHLASAVALRTTSPACPGHHGWRAVGSAPGSASAGQPAVVAQRYAHLSMEDGEIAVDMNIPWGWQRS